jgi:glycosyltransferase involved in cell wall biosynthesis
MITPLVSVIIPTYNRADTVRRSIDSALEQTYRPIEVIVVDDGSTDATREVLVGYGDRIRPIYQANGGPSVARNTGVAAARGEFIAFLDSDDTWKPAKIDRQVRLMLAGGARVPCCICNAAIINGDVTVSTTFEVSDVTCGLPEGFWMNPAPILATRFILFNQVVLIRREAFEKVGRFKPEMRLLEDYDLAFRLAQLGPWAFIEEPMVGKYNDTDGIGVLAMIDPLVHSRAWQVVLEGFLTEVAGIDQQVMQLVRRALADVKIEVRDVERQRDSGPLGRVIAKSRMFLMQKRQALRRRMPGWPRVQALASLPAVASSMNSSGADDAAAPFLDGSGTRAREI